MVAIISPYLDIFSNLCTDICHEVSHCYYLQIILFTN
jgi:hypothetical protein